MKLAIIIPALNEEGSIESIIQRCLDAREYIRRNSPVEEVEITVVSDGSTDRTVEIASQYRDRIHLIVFPKNRGYGAAIKEGWMQSDAELLGFLDADGTCEPQLFARLCSELEDSHADLVLGCRLNADSRMPLIRRIGNTLFASLLTLFSHSRVRDTASGMRVVRRGSLDYLFPLPDGLHFTPAMSARAILSSALRIVEVDMPYQERVGQSKLRVIKDGVRFLRVIMQAAFLYRPSRPLGLLGVVFFLAAWLLMIRPIVYYAGHHAVLEWMIYRFLVSYLLATSAVICVCASYISRRLVHLALMTEMGEGPATFLARCFNSRWFWAAPFLLSVAGGLLVLGSFLELLKTGATYEHWSRYIVMTFCFSTAVILVVTRGIGYVMGLVEERVRYWLKVRSHEVWRSPYSISAPNMK
jgi:glycosyltransferase involved in cell wall biosynthesis